MNKRTIEILTKITWALSNINERIRSLENSAEIYVGSNFEELEEIRNDINELEVILGSKSEVKIGQRFERLLVKSVDPNKKHYYICECKCGNIKSIYKSNLISGRTLSCGCYYSELRSDSSDSSTFRKKEYRKISYNKVEEENILDSKMVIDLNLEGKSVINIAKLLNESPSRILKIINKNKLEDFDFKINEKYKQRIISEKYLSIADLRKELNLTQDQLGLLLGLSGATISYIEKGTAVLNVNIEFTLRKILGINDKEIKIGK